MKRLRDYQKTKIVYDPISFEDEKSSPPKYLERSVHCQLTLQALTIYALLILLILILIFSIIYFFTYVSNN